jgi:hypothetical protein
MITAVDILGRGAPEIDLLEAMSGDVKLYHTKIHRPYFSTSLQVAPGLVNQKYRPTVGENHNNRLIFSIRFLVVVCGQSCLLLSALISVIPTAVNDDATGCLLRGLIYDYDR